MGPVPPRVDARVKTGLLELLDDAVEQGWPAVRACGVLELEERRARRWRSRLGHLDDALPGRAVHGLLPAEIEAIVAVFERFGDIDRSYRKLAHRGSYEGLVWVSESTVYRVLAAQGLVLPAPPPRSPTPAPAPIPEWAEWKPNQIWIYDLTHFSRAQRVAFAVMDVVSRKWLRTLVTAEESATQVEVLFSAALDDEGIWERIEARQCGSPLDGDDPEVPVLLAMSDNGPQMRAGSTREFLALCSIVARFALGHPPTRPGSRRCSVTSSGSGPIWRRPATRPSSRPSSRSCGPTTTGGDCTPASATSPPTTNTPVGATPSARLAATAWPARVPSDWPTIATTPTAPSHDPATLRTDHRPRPGH